jgi:hypothetical protein
MRRRLAYLLGRRLRLTSPKPTYRQSPPFVSDYAVHQRPMTDARRPLDHLAKGHGVSSNKSLKRSTVLEFAREVRMPCVRRRETNCGHDRR